MPRHHGSQLQNLSRPHDAISVRARPLAVQRALQLSSIDKTMARPGLSGFAILLALLFNVFLQPAAAIYQDEAYNVDFAHTLLGTPLRRNTFFHRPNAVSKATLLYTLSDKGLLGAINPRDGELVWRAFVNDSLPSSEEQSYGILRAHESSTVVFTGFGTTIRAWDAKDGRLVWERSSDEKVKSLEVLASETSQNDIVVLTEGADKGGTAIRLSGVDGTVKWSQGVTTSEYPLAISVSAQGLYVTSLLPASRGGYKVKVQTLDASTGREKSHYTLSSENEISSEASVLHVSGIAAAPLVAWTDEKVKNVHINVLGSKTLTITMLNPYGTDVSPEISFVEVPATSSVPHFLIQYVRDGDHRAEVYHVDVSSGKAQKAFDLPKVSGKGTFSASPAVGEVIFTRQSGLEVVLVSSKSDKVLDQWPVKQSPIVASSTSVLHSVSELAAKGDGHYSVRTAVVTGDGDWELYQNGNHAWTRYEGLSGITAAAFVDIPAEESLMEALSAESHSNIVSAYFHRAQRHAKDLIYLPAWVQGIPARFVSSLTGIDIGKSISPLAYDSYGFKKIVVVTTEKGRVAALGSANQGQVLWSVHVPASPDRKTWDVRRIHVQDTKIQILAADGEFLIMDGITGSIIQHSAVTQGVSYHVPLSGQDGRTSLLAISEDGTPGILPEGFPSTSHLVTQRSDGTVVGWKPTANGKTALAWSFSPRAGETVKSVTVRAAHDPVASIGRAGGDRSVLYKFLSPNLALVTASSIVLSSLSIYLLDTISGQVLYSTTHEGVDVNLPVPAVVSENWFAYSIFTDAPETAAAEAVSPQTSIQGHQLVLSELFESSIPNDRGPLGSALNYSSLSDFYRPHVESTAYVVPAPISVLSTTSTLQGITPRSLLAYTPALAGLVALPVPFLSPRRPVGRDPNPSEREEGLMKYQANLEFLPTWFLSHQREIVGVKGIVSSPTKMESSSLVFAYGDVDLFGTRVSPIGMFDILGDGFGKMQLVLTVVGLAVGTSLLAPMARRKGIDGLWRG